jgi:hypothetical protein
MPKRNQQHPAKSATGHNNPTKTTENVSHHSELDRTHKADSRELMEDREKRNGSDSDATNHRKKSIVHENNRAVKQPSGPETEGYDFSRDLNPNNRAGENHGVGDAAILDSSHSTYDIKEMHRILADLTADEMKGIIMVKDGSALEQGAKYIDLDHLEQGEFVARGNMIAEAGHHYVPKKETDYVLWNRLNQVDNPTRLDETGDQD